MAMQGYKEDQAKHFFESTSTLEGLSARNQLNNTKTRPLFMDSPEIKSKSLFSIDPRHLQHNICFSLELTQQSMKMKYTTLLLEEKEQPITRENISSDEATQAQANVLTNVVKQLSKLVPALTENPPAQQLSTLSSKEVIIIDSDSPYTPPSMG